MTALPSSDSAGPPGRRLDIAVLRIVAIVGVVLIHVSGLTVIQPVLNDTAVWWVAKGLNSATRFCVPLFVMVSGALLLKPGLADRPREFYRRRLDRLLPALVVWHVVYLVFVVVVLDSDASPSALLALVLAGRTYTALYFFWLILGLYLLTPWLRRAVSGLTPEQLLRGALVVTGATCLWLTTTTFIAARSRIDVAASPTVWTYWIPYVGYFLLGAALAQRAFSRRAGLLAAAGFVASCAVLLWESSGHAPHLFTQVSPVSYSSWVVAASTICLFVLCVALVPATLPRLVARPLERLADLTLGVFALHLLVLYALQHSGVLTVVKGASRMLELGYLVVGTLVLSWATAYLMSLVPGLRKLV